MARSEIILKSKLSRSESSGLVELTPEAKVALRRLQSCTGLSMRQIASELITQGESLVRIIGSDED